MRRGVEGKEPMGVRGEEVVRREVVAPVFWRFTRLEVEAVQLGGGLCQRL